jgi:hypothetical protein
MRGTRGGLGLLALFLALTAACGAPAAGGGGQVVELGLNDAGRTVHVHVGDVIEVTLEDQFPVPGSSLVWRVTDSPESVLAPESETVPTPAPAAGDVPYSARFAARAAGEAVLTAHGATSCEAMAKQSCPDREFTITVEVSG